MKNSNQQNNEQAIVQFQFSDSLVFNFNPNEKFKLKMRESCKKPKRIHVCIDSGKVERCDLVYDTRTGQIQDVKQLKKICLQENRQNRMVIDPRSNEFITCGFDGMIRIINMDTGKEKYTIKTDSSYNYVTWYHNPQGKKYLIVCSYDGIIDFYDWETKKIVRRIQDVEKTWIHDLLVNEKEQELISCNIKASMKLWCLKTFTCLKTFESCNYNPVTLCFVNKEKTLFAARNWTNNTGIWNKQTSQCLYSVNFIRDLIYSSELNLLVSCGGDGFIKAWKVTKDKMKLVFRIKNPFSKNGILTIRFLDSKDETRIIALSGDGNLFLVDLVLKNITWKMESGIKDSCVENMLIQ